MTDQEKEVILQSIINGILGKGISGEIEELFNG